MNAGGPAAVQVFTRAGGPFDGCQQGTAVAYDWALEPPMRAVDGSIVERQRSYLLLDAGVALTVPGYWRGGPEQHSWYVDLVRIETARHHGVSVLTVQDLYLDLVVPTDGRPYRMLDLDEFGAALADGRLDPQTARRALADWQRFLDGHLHDRDGSRGGGFPDFPPAELAPVLDWPGPAPIRQPGLP